MACSNNKERGLNIERYTFKKHFGFVKGDLGYYFMKDCFNKKLPSEDGTGYIECVATSFKAGGKEFLQIYFNMTYNILSMNALFWNWWIRIKLLIIYIPNWDSWSWKDKKKIFHSLKILKNVFI